MDIVTSTQKAVSQKQPKTLPAFSLEGKVCMVTGAARGLGYEFCRAFLDSGCTELIVVDLKQDEADAAARDLVEASAANGELSVHDFKVIGVACDVSQEDSVKQLYQTIHSRFGRIDVAVASAGIVHTYDAVDYPEVQMKRLYDINVHGAFFTAREAFKLMQPRGSGSIIMVASMSAGIVNIPQWQFAYNASKAAVKHMATSLAVEWAKTGIRVNSLSPGYMLTKLTRTMFANNEDKALQQTWEKLTPVGRIGDPEDLAGPIVYLASDASRFMTGADLLVDGGYSAI